MKLLKIYRSMNPEYGGIVSAIIYSKQALQKEHIIHVVVFDSLGIGSDPEITNVCNVEKFYGLSLKGFFKLIYKIKKYEIVSIEGSWIFPNIAAAIGCKIYNIPYIYTPHGMLDSYFSKANPIKHLKKLLYWLLFEVWIVRGAKLILYTTQEEKRRSINTFPFMNKIDDIIPLNVIDICGTSLVTTNYEPKKFTQDTNINLLFLSRIHEKKGIEILLNVISILPAMMKKKIYLTIAGSGEKKYIGRLQQLICDLDIADNIHWYGFADNDAKKKLFNSCDIFCLTSFQENFGLVVPEALCFNKPVFISTGVYLCPLIEKYNVGTVISLNDSPIINSNKLSTTIEKVRDNDFGLNPRLLFEKYFSNDAYLNNFDTKVIPSCFS